MNNLAFLSLPHVLRQVLMQILFLVSFAFYEKKLFFLMFYSAQS